MAIGHTALTANGSTWATSHVTASITPTANALVLLAVNLNVDESPSSISGNGLTWVSIDSQSYPATPAKRLSLYRAMGTPSAGAITINTTSDSIADWAVMEYTGVDTTGTNGSGAIVQQVKGTAYNGSAPPYTNSLTLAAFGSTDNATYFVDGASGNPTFSLDTGFTLLQTSNYSVGVAATSRLSNDTSPGVVQDDGSWIDHGLIALEIKAAVVASGGRIMSSLTNHGGLAGCGGIAGIGGGLAG